MRIIKGFTLLELIVVVIIIGILATLGLTQYTRTIEKERFAEAKTNLGRLRTAQLSYKLEYGNYTQDMTALGIDLPTNATCIPTHYFYYSLWPPADGGARANRCSSGGKPPNVNTIPRPEIYLYYDIGKFESQTGWN